MAKPDTYNDFDKQIYLTFTNECNWNCSYCDFPDKNNPTYDLENHLSVLKMIPDNIEVYLEGGELGLLPEDQLDLIFNSGIANTYAIATNGEFLRKGYHEKYKDKIHYILYHFAPEITGDMDITEYDIDGSIRVDYTFVLHVDNLKYVDKLLTRYSHLKFLIHLLQPRVKGLPIDNSIPFYLDVLHSVKNHLNIGYYFKARLTKMIVGINVEMAMEKKRLMCSMIYNQISINLPDNKIHRCCVSTQTDSVELTEENLSKVIRNQQVFPATDSVCRDCIANFIWDDKKINKMTKFVI